jgi:Smg protein
MENTVFDILVYVFDRYMQDELHERTGRETIEEDLHRVGFGRDQVSLALDWLADLADVRERASLGTRNGAFRVYSADELQRLDAACRGLLLTLERGGVLSAAQREIVIDRLLALESGELGIEHVKWVVLMVLSSQPVSESDGGQAAAWLRENSIMVPH